MYKIYRFPPHSKDSWQEVIRQHPKRFDEVILDEIYGNHEIVCRVLNYEPLRICHGDFHPDNILHKEEGLYIIDWQNIHIGKSVGDISFFKDRGEGFGLDIRKP